MTKCADIEFARSIASGLETRQRSSSHRNRMIVAKKAEQWLTGRVSTENEFFDSATLSDLLLGLGKRS